MKKYSIQVTETFRKVVDIEARDKTDAICKVCRLFENGDILIDFSDSCGFEVSELKE